MPGKHRLKRRRAEHTARHRTVEVIDTHTLTTRVMTNDALAAGRLTKGRYIALCGQDVCLPVLLSLDVAAVHHVSQFRLREWECHERRRPHHLHHLSDPRI